MVSPFFSGVNIMNRETRNKMSRRSRITDAGMISAVKYRVDVKTGNRDRIMNRAMETVKMMRVDFE